MVSILCRNDGLIIQFILHYYLENGLGAWYVYWLSNSFVNVQTSELFLSIQHVQVVDCGSETQLQTALPLKC